jgi:hypothetical protein
MDTAMDGSDSHVRDDRQQHIIMNPQTLDTATRPQMEPHVWLGTATLKTHAGGYDHSAELATATALGLCSRVMPLR